MLLCFHGCNLAEQEMSRLTTPLLDWMTQFLIPLEVRSLEVRPTSLLMSPLSSYLLVYLIVGLANLVKGLSGSGLDSACSFVRLCNLSWVNCWRARAPSGRSQDSSVSRPESTFLPRSKPNDSTLESHHKSSTLTAHETLELDDWYNTRSSPCHQFRCFFALERIANQPLSDSEHQDGNGARQKFVMKRFLASSGRKHLLQQGRVINSWDCSVGHLDLSTVSNLDGICLFWILTPYEYSRARPIIFKFTLYLCIGSGENQLIPAKTENN